MRDGRKLSVSLETAYWGALREIAKQKGLPVSKLVARIDVGPNRDHLASALRLFVLDHFQNVTSKKQGVSQPQSTARSHTNFVVFLIDDDWSVLRAVTRLLQAAGYRTKAYSSPEKFIDEHDPSLPGCIVLDLSMPRLNGLNVQELLAQQEIDRPIIFLTGPRGRCGKRASNEGRRD